MRRAIEFCQRAIQRMNARIAILVVVVLAGGVAAWQGFAHMARNKPEAEVQGPTKQIATGVAPGGSTIEPAVASLTDDELPTSGAAHELMGYGQPASEPPPTSPAVSNPYLPSSNDPAGGYGGQPYSDSQYGSSASSRRTPGSTYSVGDAPPATEPPADPSSAPATNPSSIATDDVPRNIYRGGAGGSISDDPAATGQPGATPYVDSSAAATPGATVAASSGNPYGTGEAYGRAYADSSPQPETEPVAIADSATSPADAAVAPERLPPNRLPNADLSASPYGARQQGGNSPTSSAGGSLNPYPTNTPPTVTPHALDAAKLAAPTPGERQLEGPQQPAVAIEKHAPPEIQVGMPAIFTTIVRNTGHVPAHHVVITDHVPAGTQLLTVRPQPQQTADGSLFWSLGTMQPGEETSLTVEVMPQTEGEIGSTANVSFAAAATSRSICTRPMLTVEHTAPPKVLIGESLSVTITVSNPGSGPATGVVIEEDVPEGLAHLAGAQLEYDVGTLRPGESKRLELSLRAEKAGIVQNTIVCRGDGSLTAQHTVQLEVVAPQLEVAVEGPKVRFLQRQATYTLEVANPGTAAARNVELVAALPRGMQFVAADSQGQYDAARHAVFWSLEELPPAKKGPVKLTVLPIEPGEQKLEIKAQAALGLSAAGEQLVQVEQTADLVHTVKDVDEVIEVGSETTYEIRVTNTGTKAATNVRIAAIMPAGIAATTGEGPTRAAGDATQVAFEPLARLNPQEEVIYKVHVVGQQPGDHIVRVQLASDEWPNAVTREESTRVYQDQ